MSKKQTLQFETETAKILKLVIHSLYANKDIFLRELISNASDACDKLRFEAQQNPDLIGDEELKIWISFDEKAKTLTIRDNGIGMNRNELIENLGTIAKSGTQSFFDQLEKGQKVDANLIGQFGVGFYSSFMVSDLVTVKSLRAGEKLGHVWESAGEGEFSVEEADDTTRGTEITLQLRDDEGEFLDKHRLKHIITTYSDHISVPIYLVDENLEEEKVNSGAAIWRKPKSEVNEEEYQEFYKAVAHQVDTPFLTLHGKAEGMIEYNYLIYVPSVKPFDLYNPDRMRRLKLYVKRVFIAEDQVDIIPRYLRFVRGVVDSEDLPLNVSRETLQANPLISKIKSAISNKILSEFKKAAANDKEGYEKFWQNFGPVVKEGLCEELEGRDKILEICRFHTSRNEELTSLDDYIDRMKDGQNEIYYLSGDNLETLKDSPQIEGFKKRGIEVLLFNDSVDNFWVQVGAEYKEKQFKSVTRADIDLEDLDTAEEGEEKKVKKPTKKVEELVGLFKAELGEKVRDVKISHKLESAPVCLAIAEGDMDMGMERFLRDQKQIPQGSAKILEVNPNHKLIKTLSKAEDNKETRDLINLLFAQALVIEGEDVTDIKGFSERMNYFLSKALAA